MFLIRLVFLYVNRENRKKNPESTLTISHIASLTHSLPKTVRFSDVYRGYRKGALGTNELNLGRS